MKLAEEQQQRDAIRRSELSARVTDQVDCLSELFEQNVVCINASARRDVELKSEPLM